MMVKIQETTDKLRMPNLEDGKKAESPIVDFALDDKNSFWMCSMWRGSHQMPMVEWLIVPKMGLRKPLSNFKFWASTERLARNLSFLIERVDHLAFKS
jgi:hypothetical protein